MLVGVSGVHCVTSDAHEDLKKAISECFPGAAWQRCIVHLERNAFSLLKVQERANREIKRRSRVVQVFPSVKSLIRLIGTACCEIDEDWSSRYYIASDSLAILNEGERAKNTAEATDRDRQRAIRLIAVAMESAGTERRAA